MKIIIAGSRDVDPYFAFYCVLRDLFWGRFEFRGQVITEFVTGMARGPDQVPLMFEGFDLPYPPVARFPANWNKHGKSAGPIRNAEMADYADGLYLVWDGKSRGSANMKSNMLKREKPVLEVVV